MVTVGEARYDLDKAKQELEMQKSLTQAKQLEVQSVQLPQVPRRQLQVRGIMDMIKRKIQGQKLEQQKSESLGTLSSYQQQLKEREQSLSQYEGELSAVESQQAAAGQRLREYQYGRKLGLRGAAPIGLSGVAREGYRDAQDSLASAQKLKQLSATLSAEGITIPQFRAMTSEQIGALSPTTISNLEDAGLLRLPETMTVTDLPPVTYRLPETMTVTDLPPVTYGGSSLSPTLQTYQIPEEYKQGPQQYAKGTAMNYNVPDFPQYNYDTTTGQLTEIQKIDTPNIFQRGIGTVAKGFDWVEYQAGRIPIPKLPVYSAIDKAKAGNLAGALGIGYQPTEISTIGQEVAKFRGGLSNAGKMGKEGITDILNLLPGEQVYSETYPERNIPIYKDETGIYNPTTGQYESPSFYTLPGGTRTTALGYIPAIVGLTPEIAGYYASAGLMLGTDVIMAGENIRNVEKVVDVEMQK